MYVTHLTIEQEIPSIEQNSCELLVNHPKRLVRRPRQRTGRQQLEANRDAEPLTEHPRQARTEFLRRSRRLHADPQLARIATPDQLVLDRRRRDLLDASEQDLDVEGQHLPIPNRHDVLLPSLPEGAAVCLATRTESSI